MSDTPRTEAFILPATEANYERLLESHGRLEREGLKMEWIAVENLLPPLGAYVVVFYPDAPWIDSQDDPRRDVAKREAVDDTHEPNNRGAGYKWRTFGPSTYFAHDITHWIPLPPAPAGFEYKPKNL